MIIDATYFHGPLCIEGLNIHTGPNTTKEAIEGNLNSFIRIYETEYLDKMLGRELSRRLSNYDPGNVELISGGDLELAERTAGIRKLRYVGSSGEENLSELLNVIAHDKISPVANYIFFFFVRRNIYNVISTGVVETRYDDSVNPNELLVNTWNDMVKMNEEVYCYLKENTDKFGEPRTDKYLLEYINILGI